MKTHVGSFLVETWYDRQSRCWITDLKSTARGGSPLLDVGGESDLSGTRPNAELAHAAAVERAAELDAAETAAAIGLAIDGLPRGASHGR